MIKLAFESFEQAREVCKDVKEPIIYLGYQQEFEPERETLGKYLVDIVTDENLFEEFKVYPTTEKHKIL